MKGVVQTKPDFEVLNHAFSCLIELTEDRPDVEITLTIEYFPIAKIDSIPGDATAFQRIPYANALNVIRWKEDTPENMTWAQMTSRKITKIVTDGNEELLGSLKTNGYGNYGEFFKQASKTDMSE